MAVFDPLRILATLAEHDVDFIVVGQVAAVLQGHPETTVDLDILPKQTMANAERLASALRSLDARHVRAVADRDDPIEVDEEDFFGWRDVRSYDTVAGRVDVIPATAGVGTYDDHRNGAVVVDLQDLEVLAASLDAIIAAKEAAGRPKDRRRLPSLQAFSEQLSARGENEAE